MMPKKMHFSYDAKIERSGNMTTPFAVVKRRYVALDKSINRQTFSSLAHFLLFRSKM